MKVKIKPWLICAENILNLDHFRKQENKSGGGIKSESHRKKDRQRNLVTAKSGILKLVMAFFAIPMYYAAYGLTSSSSQNLDVYTRSYYLGFLNDLFPCLISPLIVVFEATVIRRKIIKSFTMAKNFVHENLNKGFPFGFWTHYEQVLY